MLFAVKTGTHQLKDYIEKKVDAWASIDGNEDIREINLKINYLANRLFVDYEPTDGPSPGFHFRLEKWLKNLSKDKDRESLFRLIPELFYIGHYEFKSLYRSAYNGPIIRWLIKQENLMLDVANLQKHLQDAIKSTWFGSITDSMKINSFYNINNIPGGQDYRIEWRASEKFGDKNKILNHIDDKSIKYLILLEDFVGSGTQMKKAVEFAARLSKDLPVLVVPLVLCPEGAKKVNELCGIFSNVSFSPIITLPESAFVLPSPQKNESKLISDIRKLVVNNYNLTSGGNTSPDEKPYGPFGFKDTGGLVIMYSNTPDNTLPAIHWKSSSWDPLFPRHSRV